MARRLLAESRSHRLRTTLVTVVVCGFLIALIMATLHSSAATPPNGTLSEATPVLTYDAGPFTQPNQSPVGLGQLDSGPRCDNGAFPCDGYLLTVSLPAGYLAAHPNSGVKVTMSWTDTGSRQSDYDLYIFDGANPAVDGTHQADHQATNGTDPEVAIINPLSDGDHQYSIKIVPFQPTQEVVHVKLELLPGSGPAGSPLFGTADRTTPGIPRYQNFVAPSGSSAEASQGEFNIGFNPHTGRIMLMNLGPVWRLTPGDAQTPKKPDCCEGLWEDKSANSTNIGVDPILWTDQRTGRTLISNSTAGANAVYAYSDNDGDTWVEGGFSPPNGGADHETLGSGPYPKVAGLPNPLANQANQGQAVYYCSQSVVGPAACQRSDTLGVSYGPGVFAYQGNGLTDCHGLHGHVRVAPDGSVWLPVSQCGGAQGGVVSLDSGITWTQFLVPNAISQPQGADPSIGIDSDSTVYYAYVNNEPVGAGNPPEGHARVKVSHDHGATWTNDFDLGAFHGIKNAVEIEAVGGTSGRAAVGFLGTNVNGDYQANGFPGKWYVFIATTYDGGKTWTTVNATPNDPVQSMTGVWQQGGGHDDRNLLDFNEITVDNRGRVLYGYSDGCVTEKCIAGTAENDGSANMRVARQAGGRSLFDFMDGTADTTSALAPKPSCLSGVRDQLAAHLTWKAPDNRGADITNYQILRGTAPGNEVLIGQTGIAKTSFNDTTADPSVAHYYYVVKAINSAGTGDASNEIDLIVTPLPPPEDVCIAPGLTKLTDPSGDNHAVLGLVGPAPAGTDLLSAQIAQPFAADGVPKLVFTINTDAGQSPQAPGSSWYVAMKIPGTDPANPSSTDPFHYRAVHMTWSGPTPTFEIYIPSGNTQGGVDGRFVDTVIGPAEADSSYAAPFNKVVIVVKASDLGLSPGSTIAGFLAGVSQSAGGALTELIDQMPSDLSFKESFTVGANSACASSSPTPTPTPTPTPSPSPSPTPTPTANACPNPGPHSGTITPTTSLAYCGAPFAMSNPSSPVGETPPVCTPATPCDVYALTVSIPATDPNAYQAKVTINWTDSSSPTTQGGSASDFDVFVFDGDNLTGTKIAQGGGSDHPEVASFRVTAGVKNFNIYVVPYDVQPDVPFTGKIELTQASAIPNEPPLKPATVGPRYHEYAPPSSVGESSGEPSIGYNPVSKHAMFLAGLQTLQVTFPEMIGQPGSIPEAGLADWKDVSYIWTKTRSLDPILFTDQRTGRTFVSQLNSAGAAVLVGANSLMAYSDDDGATWTPAQINPPDGSNDHQTVGAGPYPASVPLGNDINKGDAVYYCGQSGNVLVAASTAFCSRSDDGGLNFGKSVPIYLGAAGVNGPTCSQMIHGHVKVAPDGTVYVPNAQCGGQQGIAVSTDAGTTWTVRTIPDSLPGNGGMDPSVGIASDNTIYFAYTGAVPGGNESDAHIFVAASHDRGITWEKSVDVGSSWGINNAAFPSAVAGDPDRAAVVFLGTRTSGNHQDVDFKGTWYGFVAHTYDGGKTWTTALATPNGPVQRNACIWNGGGNNPCRNLLDFNDVTMDEKGMVLFGFADGCVGACEQGGDNTYSAKATISRQGGGKGLLKQFDQDEPRFPQRPFLTGRRDDLASYLKWAPPDCGGAPISYFKIYRGTVPGSEKYIGKTSGDDFDFVDRHTDPSVVAYTYKVTTVTSVGEGLPSNIISLEVTSRPETTAACTLPGQTAIMDGIGDASDTLQQHDISSVSMAEPDNLAGNIVFTIKVVNLSTVPPGWRWSVRFLVPGYDPPATAAGASEDWFVSLTSADGAAPTFTYGTTGVPTPGGQSTARFFTTIGNLDPASNAQADGTITLVLPKEALRSSAVCKGTCGPLNPGQTINLTLGSVRATAPSTVPSAGGTNETIPDTTGPASYTLRPANLCFANAEPIARMTSDVDRGVTPLTVQFDGSSSHDPDSIDTIASYTFNFGDGGDDFSQASPVIVHTFTQAGEYDVRMVVTDSRGKTSLNTAHLLIEAESASPPPPTPTPTPTPTATPTPSATPTATPTPGQGSNTVIQFASSKYTVTEGNTQAMISVVRSGATDGSSTVRYVINDGTASQRSDFTYVTGTLTFGPGETTKAFPVLINDDAYAEGTETATIVLSGIRGASAGSLMTATLEIIDNDSSDLPGNPIDDPADFVGEHYHDFLNRQADRDGQSFWTNNIDSCGTDQGCIEARRVNVSAAFYLSIEFQQTGYLVERIYKTAFGDAQATSTLGGSHTIAVPIIRFDDFLADTQAISNGVVVLQNGWEQKLEQNKHAFAGDFVTRDQFISAYPSTMSAAVFVDRLNANAGNPLSQSERDQIVNELSAGAKTRAEVLRAVAEDSDLAKAEFNRAFVLMQYFGYLRRNPNSAPDSDYTGYDFWLSKLNDFNGDFVKAEMVKAFISSTEYRERFQGGAARGNPAGMSQALGFRDGLTRSLWVSLTPTLLRTVTGGG